MFSDNHIFLFLTLFSISVAVQSLVELPTIEKNDIAFTETVIRDTFNNIFTTLRIRNVRSKPRLKEFGTIHNFFVSITLKDCDNLKEIERLSRVYDIDNERNYITQLNDILNEKDESNIPMDNNYVTVYIVETFIKKLRHLKEMYKVQNTISNSEINPEILQHLINDEEILSNVTKDISKMVYSDETILNDNQFWVPNVRRVYNGHSADIKTFPFMASIHVLNKYSCGGTVIKNDIIVTSSTCMQTIHDSKFFRGSPEFLSVRLGSSYTDSGGEKIGVQAIHIHPHFNPSTLAHNIALLRLSHRAIFGLFKNTIKRIEFDRSPTPIFDDNVQIVVLGWGAKKDNDVRSHRISYSLLDYYPPHKCQKLYPKTFVTSRHFCGGLAPKKGGACRRDIGGPGVIKGKLVGIINFASDTCGNTPTVFTKVGFYANWMKEVMGERAAYLGLKTKSSPTKNASRQHYPARPDAKTVKDASVTDVDYVTVLRNFQDFVSTIFARARYNATSNETTTDGKDKTNTSFINVLN